MKFLLIPFGRKGLRKVLRGAGGLLRSGFVQQVAEASRTSCAGQFLSRSFVVLLRKSIPQNHNLKAAA
jgi:hypothetical protein